MAWLGFFLSFFYYILEVLDPTNYHVWFHLLPTTLDRRGRKFIWLLKLDNANGGNQTQAAITASESAIHYTIASRQLCYIIKNIRFSSAGCFCFSLENFHQKSLRCLQQKSNLSFSFFSPKFLLPNVSSAFSARRYFIAYLNFLSPFSVSDALAEIFDKLLANNFHLLYLAQKENVNFFLPPFSNCNKVVLTSQYFRSRVSFSDIDHWLRGKHRFWRPRALIVLGCQPSS